MECLMMSCSALHAATQGCKEAHCCDDSSDKCQKTYKDDKSLSVMLLLSLISLELNQRQ